MSQRVITNNQPRPLMDLCELTTKEQREYIDSYGSTESAESSSYFRYLGVTYDVFDFICFDSPPEIKGSWHGYYSMCAGLAIVIRIDDNNNEVTVGRLVILYGDNNV